MSVCSRIGCRSLRNKIILQCLDEISWIHNNNTSLKVKKYETILDNVSTINMYIIRPTMKCIFKEHKRGVCLTKYKNTPMLM